jgi:hypothetical protein
VSIKQLAHLLAIYTAHSDALWQLSWLVLCCDFCLITCDAMLWHTAPPPWDHSGNNKLRPLKGCTHVILCLLAVQVMIGASEVGSVRPLVKEGQTVKKVGRPWLLTPSWLLRSAACANLV